MEYITLFRFLANLVGTCLSILILTRGGGLESVLYILVGQRALLAVLFVGWVWRRSGPLTPPNLSVVADLARVSLVFLGMNVSAAVYKNVDVWILRGVANAAEAGYYSAADRPVQMVGLLAPLIMVAIFPSLAETFRSSPERYARILKSGTRALALLIPFVAIVITVAAPTFVRLAYGQGFEAAVAPMQILAWSLVPTFMAALLFRAILASNNERISLRVALVNMVVNVALNLVFIPLWGAIGASLVALFTPLVGLVQNYWFVQRSLVDLDARRNLLRPLAGTALAATVMLLLPAGWHIYLRGAIIALSYLAYVLLSGVISREELRVLPLLLRDLRGKHPSQPSER